MWYNVMYNIGFKQKYESDEEIIVKLKVLRI